MGQMGASAYKIIETSEAFVLITDNSNMDKLLTDETKHKRVAKGLEVVHPPEFDAARTVLIKNADSVISALDEWEATGMIGQNSEVKRVVKIPNSQHLLKIIFQNSHDTDRAIEREIISSYFFSLFLVSGALLTDILKGTVPNQRTM